MTTTSDKKLAEKYHCDERTVRRWRKDGAPLSEPAEMPAWLLSRRSIPSGTAALLEGKETKTVSNIASQDTGDDSARTGAAGALRRLESAERTTYKILQAALKSGSAASIKVARENWLA